MIQGKRTYKHFENAIVGGGVLGLWAARHAIKRGESVVVLEKRVIGAGASGGFLGALMPHMPDVWNEKKQLQYEGLESVGDAIASLEADTGLDCGFKRCGRIMPLTHEGVLQQVQQRIHGAEENWADAFSILLEEYSSGLAFAKPDWINPSIANCGVQYDNLSARVDPRAYLMALGAYVKRHGVVHEGIEVVSVDPASRTNAGKFVLGNGESLEADRLVIANGWEAYRLLQPFLGEINDGKSIGRGVKGQALLMQLEHGDDLPIVYHDGTYVVPQANNRIAIGSTSENHWSGDPEFFDDGNMDFHKKAIELVPALEDAPIVGKWAGVRPRNTINGRGTSPWLGPVPGYENLIALIGGFKITFGIAHLDHLTLSQTI